MKRPLSNLIRPYLTKLLTCATALLLAASVTGCSDNDDYDIYAAIRGRITDYITGEPISNASITLSPSNATKQTADNGEFIFEDLDPGQYTITVQKAGYQPNRKTVTAISGESTEANISLTTIPQ